MAPSRRLFLSPSEYSRRERKAIVLLTLAFIILSALVHFVIGSLYKPPHFAKPDPEQTPWPIAFETAAPRPTPIPTLPPKPTPTPPPRARSPQTAAPNRHTTQSQSLAHPRVVLPSTRNRDDSNDGNTDLPTATPGVIITPGPDVTPQVAPSFAPCKMLRKVEPDYPDWVKQGGIQGVVVVIIAIGPDGQVQSVHVGGSSGNAALDQAAVAAARASSYWCPPVDGRPEAELYQVIYTFSLDG